MRILHVINSLDPAQGGTVECVRQIGSAISAKGHDVEVAVCRDTPDMPWLSAFPLRCHALGPAFGKYAFSPKLRRWLRKEGRAFDAWIINGLWQYQGFGASRVAIELGIPYFVYAHGMLDPWNRTAHPVKYLKKLAYWLLFERATLESAAGVIFTSRQECTLAQRYFPHPRWKSIVVGNGIAEPPQVTPAATRDFKASFRIGEQDEVWLFLGRIHPKKGIDLLLKAFASPELAVEGTTLAIAGDGSPHYVRQLKDMAKELGIEGRVRWLGPLYGERKWQALSAAQLFVLPSHQENFGIAVAEALAMGVPVCTTSSVNIHEEIAGYSAGVICADSAADLERALERWQSIRTADRQAMATNARRCFEDKFRIESASTRLAKEVNGAVEKSKNAKGDVS